MILKKELTLLIERLKKDEDGLHEYLTEVLEEGNFTQEAAIGSTKQAIDHGISSLNDTQLRTIAIDMLENDVYMEECPNPWCGSKIEWGDMGMALYEGQCCECKLVEEKHECE
ncbi:hypothetical protein LCM01_20635 [Bacillus thuringiensis]|uniref:hypothetical protein n=1 Tax=Bacillus thuringiensis TaxID=1428 RepID=UPI001CD4B915|nr:hypothetical protein [Bacillus thuringiensis]MCA1002808.1 hypothetical protein [Bacillus thuringiensis]